MKAICLLVFVFAVSLAAKAHDLDSYADLQKLYGPSPVTRYIDQKDYQQILDEATSNKKVMMESQVYTINTFDQEGCEEFKIHHNIQEDICEKNIEQPLVSIIVTKEITNPDLFEKRLSLKGFSNSSRQFVDSAVDFGVMGVATFGALYAMPESVSKWDKSRGFADMAAQYSDRVKAGPVWDKDDWVINYIGHPLSGAYYYTMVRHKGLSVAQSALFSVVMSTFFWEYGVEAFAEVPSIQDLIFTPLLGSLLGEAFFQWSLKIEANGGKFLGSEKLGKTAKILMNPAGALADFMNHKLGLKHIKNADISIVSKRLRYDDGTTLPQKEDNFIGLQFKFIH